MNPMMDEKSYNSLRKEIIAWLPEKITDSHVHTPLILYEKPARDFNKNLQQIYYKDRPVVNEKNFTELFPGKKVNIIGFPLPYMEAVPKKINRQIIKQNIGIFLLDDSIKSLSRVLTNNVFGIKTHWKLENRYITFSGLVNEEKCEFLEKQKLTLLIEVSNPPENFAALKEIDSNYNFPIILPHLAFNHEGFVMSKKSFDQSLRKHSKRYDVFRLLKNTDNIYVDISLKPDFDLIKTATEFLGAERILYGTDYPFGLTPRMREERNKENGDVYLSDIRDILLGKKNKSRWKYYKNIYLLLWVLKQVCEKKHIDPSLILYKNAQEFFQRRE